MRSRALKDDQSSAISEAAEEMPLVPIQAGMPVAQRRGSMVAGLAE